MNAPVSSICPVPVEQQPINEYSELKDAWLFCWATLGFQHYLAKIAWTWGWSWLVAGPIAAASFSPTKYPVQFLLVGGAGASLMLGLVLLRLYLGWFYIRNRLLDETVFYEESGWYDGQVWCKPPEVLMRDRLIVSYEIQPILQRLHRTFTYLALSAICGSLVWIVA